jgi:hypothetical protein
MKNITRKLILLFLLVQPCFLFAWEPPWVPLERFITFGLSVNGRGKNERVEVARTGSGLLTVNYFNSCLENNKQDIEIIHDNPYLFSYVLEEAKLCYNPRIIDPNKGYGYVIIYIPNNTEIVDSATQITYRYTYRFPPGHEKHQYLAAVVRCQSTGLFTVDYKVIFVWIDK